MRDPGLKDKRKSFRFYYYICMEKGKGGLGLWGMWK